jgi:hypothetical protein
VRFSQSEDKAEYSMMNYEKYKPKEAEMIAKIKDTKSEFTNSIKKLVYLLLQRSKEKVNQCMTNHTIHLDLPRSISIVTKEFMNRKGIALILDITRSHYYSLEITKHENTFTVFDEYLVCSFSEIINHLMEPATPSSCFLVIYSVPFVHNIELIGDHIKKQATLMRFVNVKSPYTYNLKDIFTEISVFIGEVAKDVEDDFGFELTQNQVQYLNYLPKALKDLIIYSPLLLQLMKYKIEVEINSNLLQRREILFVFLLALEKESLSRQI